MRTINQQRAILGRAKLIVRDPAACEANREWLTSVARVTAVEAGDEALVALVDAALPPPAETPSPTPPHEAPVAMRHVPLPVPAEPEPKAAEPDASTADVEAPVDEVETAASTDEPVPEA